MNFYAISLLHDFSAALYIAPPHLGIVLKRKAVAGIAILYTDACNLIVSLRTLGPRRGLISCA